MIDDIVKNKKGFTLIELIGIIIILGVIVIIGIPSIMKILENNKNKKYEVFEKNLFLAAETYVSDHIEEIDALKVVGGTYEVRIYTLLREKLINNKALYNPLTETNLNTNVAVVKVTVLEDMSYGYELTKQSSSGTSVGSIVYSNGTVVYFNPEKEEICTNYTISNSTNEVVSGCLKWYVYNDYPNADSVTLLLDHNTTATVGDAGMDVATLINSKTSTWAEGLNPRNITAVELANIFGVDVSKMVSGYKFREVECQTVVSAKTSQYAWLYDRTSFQYSVLLQSCLDSNYTCVQCGAYYSAEGTNSKKCVNSNTLRGYFIGKYGYDANGSVVSVANGLSIDSTGIITAYGRYKNGIRPVITIDKTLLLNKVTPCSSTYASDCKYCKSNNCGEYVG